MLHTPLHRALGLPPGPLTDQMIQDAVDQGIEESDELDWKTKLPPQKEFRTSDSVKDIAAFANAGGGLLVFGVTETEKAADGREDAGELTENYERTIRQACMTAITPPVFGVQTQPISSSTGKRAVALLVPASPDGPHLVYRDDVFGAPLRTGTDTHWMREQQIAEAYRARFERARRGEQALQEIYDDMAAALRAPGVAVLVGAARPRTLRPRTDHDSDATTLAYRAQHLTRWWLSGNSPYGPLEDVKIANPRPTLSGQHLPPENAGDLREAHVVILDDGSIGMSWRAGGHKHEKTGVPYEAHQIPAIAIEAFIAALVALVHTVAGDKPSGDYEIILGIEEGNAARAPLEVHERSAAPPAGVHRTVSGTFRPIRATVDPSSNDEAFIGAAVDVATSALNQVGINKPWILSSSLPRRPRELT
ncbi:AlbA family DNA-binding domain-containing protein [Microbacterium testaceum]|uniref:AlbA family DNA-binding domain-containing protein n=1 Tax=Microbacterium testaceum TaxID=2033 RepID=UPI002AC7CCE2|nr:ATP-binding protein [Microbacterium testaceum]MDZ5146372.1 ATP-binding protein [Microbacterium testaceum]